MKDNEIRELVNQLRDVAIKYHGTGQLREQIARTVRARMHQASPACTCPSGDGSLRWPCPVHTGNSPVIGIDPASGPDRTVEVRFVAPPGYVMVPKELTPEMRDAWDSAPNSSTDDDVNMCNAYRAMLAAAQQEVK